MTMSGLPRVRADATFVDWLEVGQRASVVVDGPRLPGSVLCLSHWPDADTPVEVAADTSAEIVVRYLDSRPDGDEVGIVTNNHYDEDGVLGIWLLLERPGPDDRRRQLAVDAATAGDFHTWERAEAAQSALTLMAMAERDTTPLPEVLRALSDRSGRDPAGAITAAVLPRVGRILDDPARYARLWGPRWQRIESDRALLASGEATLVEHPAVDLTVVRAPRLLDPFALDPLTAAMRVLQIASDGAVDMVCRYETWVRYHSRRLTPRPDLGAVAARLNALDPGPGRWSADPVSAMTPRLSRRAGGRRAPTTLAPDRLAAEVVASLADGERA